MNVLVIYFNQDGREKTKALILSSKKKNSSPIGIINSGLSTIFCAGQLTCCFRIDGFLLKEVGYTFKVLTSLE